MPQRTPSYRNDGVRAVIGKDWSETYVRQAMYERAKAEALAQDTNFAWLAFGEAAYANGIFNEAVSAFERGFSTGSASGVFGVRNSYPQALRALGKEYLRAMRDGDRF